MNKAKKTLTYLFVFLVLISNTGITITSEFCNMTKKSSCKCIMNKTENNVNIKDVVFKSKPCCEEKRKEISNNSVFDNYNKNTNNILTGYINLSDENTIQIHNSNPPVFQYLIFYKLSRDIPILYSSILI